jgi:hypothetical protein
VTYNFNTRQSNLSLFSQKQDFNEISSSQKDSKQKTDTPVGYSAPTSFTFVSKDIEVPII